MTAAVDPVQTPNAASPSLRGSAKAARFASVDALRGFVMFTMLFVNDIGGPNVPWWMMHWHPSTGNGMTFVDWVFGGFLFIVGMSIPLAFANRLARGDSFLRLVGHVVLRAASLLLLGWFMVNGENGPDVARLGWPASLWQMLVFLFAILAYLPGRSRAIIGLRVFSFAGLAYLAFVFRDKNGLWMRPHYWGILGLIGWAYLAASMAYLLLHRRREWLVAACGIFMALFFAQRAGAFDSIGIDRWINIGEHLGSHASLAMAGVVLGTMILDASASQRQKLGFAMTWGLLLLLAAGATYASFGINKNYATPAWCLICAAITCWLWAAISFLIDSTKITWPLALLIRGGQNVLLAYMLMPLLIRLIGLCGFEFYGRVAQHSLAAGIARSLVMSALVLGLAGFLKDRGMRLRL